MSALAPENLAKPRPKAPFDLTGNWFIDNSPGIQGWLFGPATIPKLTPAAQKHRDAYVKAIAEGKVYRDDIGQCWPAGVPIIMTRVWPIAMIQTADRDLHGQRVHEQPADRLSRRPHRTPIPTSSCARSTASRSAAGKATRWWSRRRNFIDDEHHWVDQGVPASGELRIVERIRLINNGNQLEIAMTLTDPKNWEGEWKGVRRWNRVNDIDVQEVECRPDLNEHLQSTSSKVHVR